jgi:hypothetical protein
MAGGIGGGGGIGGPIGTEPDPKPPVEPTIARAVNEELVWKARAVRAETRVGELESRVAEIEQQLQAAQTQATAADQRRELELELTVAGAIDLETVTMLADHALAQPEAPDVRTVVAELKRKKPFLFRAQVPVSAMSSHIAPAGDLLDELAEEARQSGNRAAVLKYLRARRGA